MRLVNQAGLDLIKESENDKDPDAGYRVDKNGVVTFEPYPDPVKIPTIGFGTIMYENGDRVTLHDPAIGMLRAQELLQYELREKCQAIDMFLRDHHINLNENQFSALVSLAYNCGVGAITNRDSSMRAALIKRDNKLITEAFRKWVYAGRKKWPGLVTRREKEIKLFFK